MLPGSALDETDSHVSELEGKGPPAGRADISADALAAAAGGPARAVVARASRLAAGTSEVATG